MIAMTTPLVTTPWVALSAPVMKDLMETVKTAQVSMNQLHSDTSLLKLVVLCKNVTNVYLHIESSSHKIHYHTLYSSLKSASTLYVCFDSIPYMYMAVNMTSMVATMWVCFHPRAFKGHSQRR